MILLQFGDSVVHFMFLLRINGRQEFLDDTVLPVVHCPIPLFFELLIVLVVYVESI